MTDEVVNGVSTAYSFEALIDCDLDTGSSLTLIPKTIAPDFFGRLLVGQQYVTTKNGRYQLSCKNKMEFPSIFFMVDGYWIEIHPEDYVIELTSSKGTLCILGIQAHDKKSILLG